MVRVVYWLVIISVYRQTKLLKVPLAKCLRLLCLYVGVKIHRFGFYRQLPNAFSMVYGKTVTCFALMGLSFLFSEEY
jgi:hypothetical protein